MSKHNNDLTLKLAWQTAFELRTCPDNETLLVSNPGEELKAHLAICHICREKLAMNQEERDAWKILRNRFVSTTMKPGIGTEKQAGQVWTIKKKFGGWSKDNRFIKPPSVLLLERVDETSSWKVVQLYGDKKMSGEGDVALDDRFGFAETWNCYSLKDDRFEMCLGVVSHAELEKVASASVSSHHSQSEESIISFFRSMEIEVGNHVTALLSEEPESAVQNVYELMPGLIVSAQKAKNIVIEIAANVLEQLCNSYRPKLVLRGAIAGLQPIGNSISESVIGTLTKEQRQLLEERCSVIPLEVVENAKGLQITLKWFDNVPEHLPTARIRLRGCELSNISWSVIGKDRAVITCSDEHFAEPVKLAINNIRMILVADELMFVVD